MTSAKSNWWKPKKGSFINRNLVTIVMIPTIIGIHYGWLLLQKNESLVKEDERIGLPIVTGARLVWKSITGGKEDPNSK